MATPLKSVRGFLLDMDGTIYLSDKLLPGARELIEYLRGQEMRPHLRSCHLVKLRTGLAKQRGDGVGQGMHLQLPTIGQHARRTEPIAAKIIFQFPQRLLRDRPALRVNSAIDFCR